MRGIRALRCRFFFLAKRSYMCDSAEPAPQQVRGNELGASLVHGADEGVDFVVPAAVVALVDVVEALLGHAAERGRQLEGEQEVGALLKGRAAGVDLVDEVLNADDVLLAKGLQSTKQSTRPISTISTTALARSSLSPNPPKP